VKSTAGSKLVKLNIRMIIGDSGQMGRSKCDPCGGRFSGGKRWIGFMGALPEKARSRVIEKRAGLHQTASADETEPPEILTQSRERLPQVDVEAAARGFGAILQMDQQPCWCDRRDGWLACGRCSSLIVA